MSATKKITCAGCAKTEELITVHYAASDWQSIPNGWLMRIGPETQYACNIGCAQRADEIAAKVPRVISLDALGSMTVNDAIDTLKGVKDAVAAALKTGKK